MLLIGLVAVAFNALIGYGPVGVVIAFLIAGGMAFASWWKSDEVALRLSRAHPADPTTYARLHNLVEGLCIATGLPKPRIYVIDDPAPNAFATGRNPKHAAIAVTTGLLEKMNRVELEGVLAHELSHVRNYDILVSTLAVTLVGVAALLSDIGIRSLWFGGRRRGNDQAGAVIALLALVFLVLAPIMARVMQLAVSRRRESLADVLRRGDHPVPAGADLGAGEAAGRPDGGADRLAGHRPPVDRGAHAPQGRHQAVVEVVAPVRHPPAAGRPDRRPAGDVSPHRSGRPGRLATPVGRVGPWAPVTGATSSRRRCGPI